MTTPNHRKQRANNSREHILDTYVDLLIRSGERAATLDAVATAAKVGLQGRTTLPLLIQEGAP